MVRVSSVDAGIYPSVAMNETCASESVAGKKSRWTSAIRFRQNLNRIFRPPSQIGRKGRSIAFGLATLPCGPIRMSRSGLAGSTSWNFNRMTCKNFAHSPRTSRRPALNPHCCLAWVVPVCVQRCWRKLLVSRMVSRVSQSSIPPIRSRCALPSKVST